MGQNRPLPKRRTEKVKLKRREQRGDNLATKLPYPTPLVPFTISRPRNAPLDEFAAIVELSRGILSIKLNCSRIS